MDQGIVVELDKGLQRHAEALAVMQQRAVMVRNAPGAGVQVMAIGELHILGGAAEFRVLVAAIERPVPAAGAVLVFQDLDLVARLLQLIRCKHAAKTGAKHQHGGARARAAQVGRTGELGFSSVTHGGHGLVQGRGAAHHADGRQKLTACCAGQDFPHANAYVQLHKRYQAGLGPQRRYEALQWLE